LITTEEWISATSKKLDLLTRRKFSAWFAYAAERIFPLYSNFCEMHGWDQELALRKELDRVWFVVTGSRPSKEVSQASLDIVARLTPHGDDFDAPNSTFAQDVAICVDCAIRALLPDEEINGEWCEFAIEPAIIRATEEAYGFLSPNSSARTEWSSQIIKHPALTDLLQDLNEITEELSRQSDDDYQKIRIRARR
jgi:uncharacterized protein YjaG (DUF416 family)